MTFPRASSFASGATESSRSRKTSSAGRPGAFESILGDEPGTERQDRLALTVRALTDPVSFLDRPRAASSVPACPPRPDRQRIVGCPATRTWVDTLV